MGTMKNLVFPVLLFVVWGNAKLFADVFAMENKSEVLYGQGVHAFFDGDYKGAIRLLKQVEQLGSEDPRPYYFLAIANHRLGNDNLADEQFRKAARLEWEGQAIRDYNVSDALRRIQGNERLYIEMYRRQAKIDWQKAEQRRRDAKYEKGKSEEKDVLATLAKSFVGAAPFGARSVDPFRDAENDGKNLIPSDDAVVTPVRKAATDKTKGETKDEEEPGVARTQTSKTSVLKTEEESDDNESDGMEGEKKADTKKEESDDKDDSFADTDMKKEEKKETKEDTADDDDPFK